MSQQAQYEGARPSKVNYPVAPKGATSWHLFGGVHDPRARESAFLRAEDRELAGDLGAETVTSTSVASCHASSTRCPAAVVRAASTTAAAMPPKSVIGGYRL